MTDLRAETATINAKERIKLRKLFHAAGVDCKPNEEPAKAPVFLARLAELVQGVVWDTRVWMAHRGTWPSAADRMAADLGWPEEINDSGLRSLTEAIHAAGVPILTGGQGIVAGSLRAFVEWVMPEGKT